MYERDYEKERRESYDSRLKSMCSDDSLSLTSSAVDGLRPGNHHTTVDPAMRGYNARIQILRVLLALTLLIVVTGATYGTYRMLIRQEEVQFEQAYEIMVDSILAATRKHRIGLFTALHDVAQLIAQEASLRQESFPFVTVPLFELIASQARQTSRIRNVFWGPLVSTAELETWHRYSNANQDWLNVSRHIHSSKSGQPWDQVVFESNTLPIPKFDTATKDPASTTLQPLWQQSPPPQNSSVINTNLQQIKFISSLQSAVAVLREPVIDAVRDYSESAWNYTLSNDGGHQSNIDAHRFSTRLLAMAVQPIFNNILEKSNDAAIAGHVFALFSWDQCLESLLWEGMLGITIVIKNSCGQIYTYKLNERKVTYVGEGDHHDKVYDRFHRIIPYHDGNENAQNQETLSSCLYSFHAYPNKGHADFYLSNLPRNVTLISSTMVFLLLLVLCFYESAVTKRNKKVMELSEKSSHLVSEIFPWSIRKRLIVDGAADENVSGKSRLKNFLDGSTIPLNGGGAGHFDSDFFNDKPIADLFPDTTVLYADIAGFTAWSSTREPVQVFVLLETIYKAFDDIAKTRRIFKVETVGDCYVAVSGLPDPRKDHAVAMSRFAIDCMQKMHKLTKKLEVRLGPDTADLDIRFGMHSGPVTAGVLRGERSRFQLFGETMAIASLMESTGESGKIQLSHETADLLVKSGKQQWLTPREGGITCKSKGDIKTFWLTSMNSSTEVVDEKPAERRCEAVDIRDLLKGVDGDVARILHARDDKAERLIKWNVEILINLLKKIITHRAARQPSKPVTWPNQSSSTVIEEVVEVISLPDFNDKLSASNIMDVSDVSLPPHVEEQMAELVSSVAAMYHGNPFHNFEHASHVTLSVVKLLSRVIAPDIASTEGDNGVTIHDYSYGITSDPLTQFSCVFSALIHDVDHSGLPNAQLIIENPQLASFYKNKSVAEQNSVDLAWVLLQDDSFMDLRAAICTTSEELVRFRQLVVNSVMATDIIDGDLKALRNNRWEKAFSQIKASHESRKEDRDRKATIVIEHLIQASDVAHTMQHWHVYRKWNERLFEEMYVAYIRGRAPNNPSESWYKGEIGFFDFYIIPLAKKLKYCGVFGVSSEEYLNYAEKNRKEWEQRGQEIVGNMLESVRAKYEIRTV